MDLNHSLPEEDAIIGRKILIYFIFIILMSNLSALVDAFLYPEIPYFDTKHLIVGGVTGLLSSIFLGLLIFYTRRQDKALVRVNDMEFFLSICANCKKIRTPNSDLSNKESWQSLESFITEKTGTRFSHSICPECAKALYPQIYVDVGTDNT